MISRYESIKIAFRLLLDPVFDLLIYKKKVLPYEEWSAFVLKTENRIIQNPDQYLGADLPSAVMLEEIVHELFIEYIEDEAVFMTFDL